MCPCHQNDLLESTKLNSPQPCSSPQNGPLPFSKFEYVVAWLLREVMSPYIILLSHLNSHVMWRNKKYRIKWGGLVDMPVVNKLEKVEVA